MVSQTLTVSDVFVLPVAWELEGSTDQNWNQLKCSIGNKWFSKFFFKFQQKTDIRQIGSQHNDVLVSTMLPCIYPWKTFTPFIYSVDIFRHVIYPQGYALKTKRVMGSRKWRPFRKQPSRLGKISMKYQFVIMRETLETSGRKKKKTKEKRALDFQGLMPKRL